MNSAPDNPATPTERIQVIDALRGFALFGVLMVNLRYFSLIELAPAESKTLFPMWDRVFGIVMEMFMDTKAITIFTILFGVGFALQTQRAASTDTGPGWYTRRQLILLAIALLHTYVIWSGDILRYYAVLGLALIPFMRLSNRTLVGFGIVLVVAGAIILKPMMRAILPQMPTGSEMTAMAYAAYHGTNFGTVLKTNFSYSNWELIHGWSLWIFIFGRIMIGAALGRSGMLQHIEAYHQSWKRCFVITASIGVVFTLLALLYDHKALGAHVMLPSDLARSVVRMIRAGGSLALGVAYIAGFVLLFQSPTWYKRLVILVPLGRMALTNYLMQSVIGVAVFYGIGLGVRPQFGLAGVMIAGVVVYTTQIFVSRWWLTRYQFGPVEWCWRSLSYGEVQPMRREDLHA